MKKPKKYHLNEVIKVNILEWDKLMSWASWYDTLRRTHCHFCGISAPNTRTNFNLRDILQNNWPMILKTIDVMTEKDKKNWGLKCFWIHLYKEELKLTGWFTVPSAGPWVSLNVWEWRAKEAIPLLPQGLHTGCSPCLECSSSGICIPCPAPCSIYTTHLILSPHSDIFYFSFLLCSFL